jgi:hypothetical protein
MNYNPQLADYNQDDVQKLYSSGSIVPNVDVYGNLVIENVTGKLFSTAVTVPLVNTVFNSIKVETKYDSAFKEL